MITEPPEHLIEAAIKAATVVTKMGQQSANNAAMFGHPPSACSSTETITTTKFLDRARAIEVVKAVLRAVADGRA